MPKGVEHQGDKVSDWARLPVIRSLMPKGVEHSAQRWILSGVTCDSIFDAERR